MYITLTFAVDNLDTVRKVYDTIELQRAESVNGPWVTLTSGIDPYPITLIGVTSPFTVIDSNGTEDNWYQSRYYCTSLVNCPDTSAKSGWSDPIRGEAGEICYSPTYPVEIAYGTLDQLVIDRVRRLIGDPVGLKREYNECDNIHEGGKVYELETKGWPCSINIGNTMYNTTYNTLSNPAVNGYRYLNFTNDITTLSGVNLKVNVFYYIFRHSDREIMEAYDTAYPPAPLTIITATNEVYMLQTAITLLGQEIIEDSAEDGAIIVDETSKYDNTKAIQFKIDMLDRLQKRLDAVVKSLLLCSITGVLID